MNKIDRSQRTSVEVCTFGNSPAKVLWLIFFPYSFGLPFLFATTFIWNADYSLWSLLVSRILGVSFLVGCLWMLLRTLFMKEIVVYSDRVEQRFWLFRTKTVYLHDALYFPGLRFVIGPHFKLLYHAINTPSYSFSFMNGILFDASCVSKKDISAFEEALAEVSGHSVDDFRVAKASIKLDAQKH